jgi:hypothetical protein
VARFYFHFADGQTTLHDVGTELPDLDDARVVALRTTHELMLTAGPSFWAGEPHRVWVTDQPNGAGKNFFTIRLSAATSP